MVKTGTYTKRGVERKAYEIVPSEAEIVKKIFDLFTEDGCGGVRIAKYLNEKGYRTHKGNQWSYSTVNNMLRNPVYTGFLCYHKTSVPLGGGKRVRIKDSNEWIFSKEKIPDIAIISEEQFKKAQKIKKARCDKNKQCEEINKEYFKYQTKGDMLFIGYITCGGCLSKLSTRSSKREMKMEDGSKGFTRYNYYACRNSSCGRDCNCKKKSYKSNTIEEPVLNEIYNYLDLLEEKDLKEYVRRIHNDNNNNEGKKIGELEKNIKELKRKNDLLKSEIIKVITGESNFSRELLSQVIEENKNQIEQKEKEKKDLEQIKRKKEIDFEEMIKVKSIIPKWKEVLKNANIGKKKMMLASIIKEIIVYDDRIDIKLRIGFNEFVDTARKLNINTIKNGDSFCFDNLCNSGTNNSNSNMGSF